MAASSPISGAGPFPDLITLMDTPEGVTSSALAARGLNTVEAATTPKAVATSLRTWDRVICAEREVDARV